MRTIPVILISLYCASAMAAKVGERFEVESDPNGKYTIVELGGKGKMRTIVTKRDGKSGTSYSQRLYDCEVETFKYLGSGDTLEQMRSRKPDKKMSELVDGSIADWVGGAACDNYEREKRQRRLDASMKKAGITK